MACRASISLADLRRLTSAKGDVVTNVFGFLFFKAKALDALAALSARAIS